jgi:hypothetical protein
MIDLSTITLDEGAHASREAGLCLMEAVAYFADEPHSDSPKCASPVLTRFGIRLNDRFTADERQLLKPLIPKLIGTRTTVEHDRRRAYVLVDAAVREIVPMAMNARGWEDLAAQLRSIAPIVDRESAVSARKVSEVVRDEARKRSASADASAADAYAAYAADAASAADAAYAADDASAAAYAAYAADDASARRPIVLASIAAFERAIAI